MTYQSREHIQNLTAFLHRFMWEPTGHLPYSVNAGIFVKILQICCLPRAQDEPWCLDRDAGYINWCDHNPLTECT